MTPLQLLAWAGASVVAASAALIVTLIVSFIITLIRGTES